MKGHPTRVPLEAMDGGSALMLNVLLYFQSGSFVVRKSNKGGAENPYTLTLFFSYKMYNLHVRKRRDGQWALGKEKPSEQVNIRKEIKESELC